MARLASLSAQAIDILEADDFAQHAVAPVAKSAALTNRPRVAIIHDWLMTYAGAERVLAEMLAIWPDADLFATFDFLSDEDRKKLSGKKARTTFAQHIPTISRTYRTLLPLMQLAAEQHDVREYDLIVSSSHAVAKGVLTGPDQTHVSYVHSPMRYAWDLQHEYLRDAHLDRGLKSFLARYVLHRARIWDSRTANGVDSFVANSHFVSRRIAKAYGRPSSVIYPPVDTEFFTPDGNRDQFYLAAARLVPYKKMHAIAEAFKLLPNKRLLLVGDGPEAQRVRSSAGPNVEMLGHVTNEALRDYLRGARAFIFAAEEDFGITPVEAQACGTPVIAFGRGGATETIVGLGNSRPTGVFFNQQTPEAIAAAVQNFEKHEHKISSADCRSNALRFSTKTFREKLLAHVTAESEKRDVHLKSLQAMPART